MRFPAVIVPAVPAGSAVLRVRLPSTECILCIARDTVPQSVGEGEV